MTENKAGGTAPDNGTSMVKVAERSSLVHWHTAYYALREVAHDRVDVVLGDLNSHDVGQTVFVQGGIVLDKNKNVVAANPALAQTLLLAKSIADEADLCAEEDAKLKVMDYLLAQGRAALGALKEYCDSSGQTVNADLALLQAQSRAEDDPNLLPEYLQRVTNTLREIERRAGAWASFTETCAVKAQAAIDTFHEYLSRESGNVRAQAERELADEVGQLAAARAERTLREIPLPPGVGAEPLEHAATGRGRD